MPERVSTLDYERMSRALQLAAKGLYSTKPNPRVGCVIVKNQKVVGEGFHLLSGEPHAEIHALQQAGRDAENSNVYVTLEPCSHQGQTPPCADALIEARVKKVFIGMTDPNPEVSGQGIKKLQAAGIEVFFDLLKKESMALNPGFIKRMTEGLPWVTCKLAMSLDGRTSMSSGESQWITSSASREDVHRLRARSCAILTGSGTILADNPSLTARLDQFKAANDRLIVQPHRVVLDTYLKIPLEAKLLHQSGFVLIFHASDDQQKILALEATSATLIKINIINGKLDLHAVLQHLAGIGVNEVLVEAGSILAGSFLEQNLADEFLIYMASHIMGDSAHGLFHLPDLQQMQQRIPLHIKDICPIGNDWRITATRQST